MACWLLLGWRDSLQRTHGGQPPGLVQLCKVWGSVPCPLGSQSATWFSMWPAVNTVSLYLPRLLPCVALGCLLLPLLILGWAQD